MGAFSDNFYSWLEKEHAAEKAAMDASPNGYKHPDGTPCRAKSIESCPFYKKDLSESEDVDNLGVEPTPQYDRKVKELEQLCKDGGLTSIPGFENATFESLKKAYDEFLGELEMYEAEPHEVLWTNTRKIRDEIYENNKDKQYATINAETGDVREDCTGFGVTFHTTLSDPDKKTGAMTLSRVLTDEEYDRKVTELVKLGGADTWNVGIFQDNGEVSIDCKDAKRAIAMMLYWNQNSVYNYTSQTTIYNLTYDEAENPGLDRGIKRIEKSS